MLKNFFLLRHKYKIKKLMKGELQVGENTRVYTEAQNFGFNPGLVKIGNNCVITAKVKFITDPVILKAGPDRDKTCDNRNDCSIIIRDNCFIGIGSIIYPGVVIGPNTIIGAGTVVMSDVPPDMCFCGNPSRVACTTDLYGAMCRKSLVPDYVAKYKRTILLKHFWNIQECAAKQND